MSLIDFCTLVLDFEIKKVYLQAKSLQLYYTVPVGCVPVTSHYSH